MNARNILISTLFTLFFVSPSFAGWKDLAGDVAGKTLGSADAGDVAVAMSGDEIMVNYVASLALINVAQIQITEALGLTEQAQQLKANREFLEGGSVPKTKQLKKVTNYGNTINDDINAALEEGKELSASSKKKIAWGTAAYAGGIYTGTRTVTAAANIKKSDLVGKPMEVVKKFKSMTFIAKTGKSYLSSVKDTSVALGKFAKTNGISVPSRVGSVDELPDDI